MKSNTSPKENRIITNTVHTVFIEIFLPFVSKSDYKTAKKRLLRAAVRFAYPAFHLKLI